MVTARDRSSFAYMSPVAADGAHEPCCETQVEHDPPASIYPGGSGACVHFVPAPGSIVLHGRLAQSLHVTPGGGITARRDRRAPPAASQHGSSTTETSGVAGAARDSSGACRGNHPVPRTVGYAYATLMWERANPTNLHLVTVHEETPDYWETSRGRLLRSKWARDAEEPLDFAQPPCASISSPDDRAAQAFLRAFKARATP